MKRLLIGVGVCMALFGSMLALVWPSFGKEPSAAHRERLMSSPNWDAKTQRFVNRRQAEYDEMQRNFDFPALIKKQMFGREERVPKRALPTELPKWEAWEQQTDLQYIWLGHSTILLRLEGQNILFDPVFGNAAPIPFAVSRFQKPVVSLNDLPPIDVVVISHDHYDHLSKDAVQFFADKDTRFLVPLGVSSYLVGWGISEDRITELDWWDEMETDGLTFACTPSQHFSGRRGPYGNQTLWASWVLKSQSESIYFSGDSGYDIHFRQIGEKYGPFDVTFMENGQYNQIWPLTHLFPEEAVQAHVELRGKRLQPIHWGAFKLSTHDWNEPVKRTLAASEEKDVAVLLPKQGECVHVQEGLVSDRWWE